MSDLGDRVFIYFFLIFSISVIFYKSLQRKKKELASYNNYNYNKYNLIITLGNSDQRFTVLMIKFGENYELF